MFEQTAGTTRQSRLDEGLPASDRWCKLADPVDNHMGRSARRQFHDGDVGGFLTRTHLLLSELSAEDALWYLTATERGVHR